MNLRTCDCCLKQFKELNRVSKYHGDYFLCAGCYNELPGSITISEAGVFRNASGHYEDCGCSRCHVSRLAY